MVYIVVLNWKNAIDTIACINSLLELKNVLFRIIICDNSSPDDSYSVIRTWLLDNGHIGSCKLIELDRHHAEKYTISSNEDGVYLIQTGANLGYAGGNNVGIRFAMNQSDMRYVWVLNNDTVVDPFSLNYLVNRCEADSTIGICGSKLVYDHDRSKLQGFGGIYNSWFCSTKHYAAFADSDLIFDEVAVSSKIDYVIGASIFFPRLFLEEIGLFCEDYFLYYEEIDMCLRAKGKFNIGIAVDSIVYHKEGASTNGGVSVISDFYSVRNRLIITKKFNPLKYIFVWCSLFGVLFNRIMRGDLVKAKNVFFIIFGFKR